MRRNRGMEWITWALWILLLALILGGKPWFFPGGGKYLMESWESGKSLSGSGPSGVTRAMGRKGSSSSR